MRKWIVISDSFKGTLSSRTICRLARAAAEKAGFDGEFITIPVADGGEGTVDCFVEACGGVPVELTVSGPFAEPVQARYARLPDGTAVVECAACAGLPMVEGRQDPERTTTYGVGELIRHAVEHGARRVILGLGGSCTNDGGCGAAAALGVRFTDHAGQAFVPTGGTLQNIAGIDISAAQKLLSSVTLLAMCDIDNPMYGKTGAAYVFGPQKGADPAMVERLDCGLRALDAVIQQKLGRCVASLPGAGAAGAFGAGCVAFLGARLQSGIETVLETVHFDEQLHDCELVVTGEGKLDEQSVHGKVISGIAKHCAAAGVEAVALVGALEADADALHRCGLCAARSINPEGIDFRTAAQNAEMYYTQAMCALIAERCGR